MQVMYAFFILLAEGYGGALRVSLGPSWSSLDGEHLLVTCFSSVCPLGQRGGASICISSNNRVDLPDWSICSQGAPVVRAPLSFPPRSTTAWACPSSGV
ncbi:hypothetical protein CIPAW_13G000400 [Carya illinoinensis]|uniref:Secreted protein n=1 Tax=Carya illinoinensis TaxID=32201 RepID=A0A8T1NK97_CARIL|nr:hypothetical protein CIPAW_13G000400 [Carya illinoinensis]